jgi:hypothetical protein
MNRHQCGIGIALLLAVAACDGGSDKKPTEDAGQGGTGGAGALTGGRGGGGGDVAARAGNGGSATVGLKLVWALGEPFPLPDASAGTSDTPPSVPIGGMKVCVHGHDEIACVMSDAEGHFTLVGLPPRTELVLTFDKAGYTKASKTVGTASTDMQGVDIIYISPDSHNPPVTLKGGKGGVSFLALTPVPGSTDPTAVLALPGVTVALSPATGDGPFFYDRRIVLHASATQTLSSLGFFYNLDPGEYTLSFDHPKFACAPLNIGLAAWGLPAPPHGVRFTVLADYLTTEMLTYCTPKSVIAGADGG